VVVIDDQLGGVSEFVSGDDNGNNLLDPGETWVYSGSSVADTPGQHENIATVTAYSVDDDYQSQPLLASDPAYYFVESLKFFVVDAEEDATFTYTDGGSSTGSSDLVHENSDPRGAASNAAGDTLWVVDKDRNVFIYYQEGAKKGTVDSWKANKVSDKVQGITTDGTDIWIVQEDRKVFYFAGGASFTSGSYDPTSQFKLEDSDIGKPTGITTDGEYLWVVDKDRDRVYRYTTNGSFLDSWALDPENTKPTGITINPADPSDGTIWVVDKDRDQVFVYANGKTGGMLSGRFDLDPNNGKPEGIADPTLYDATGSSASKPVAQSNSDLPPDVNGDGYISPVDALLVIAALNHGQSGQLSGAAQDSPYLDVNNDGFVSPVDALIVIARLNRGEGEDGAEGEAGDLLSATAPPTGDSGSELLISQDPLTTETAVTSELAEGKQEVAESSLAVNTINYGSADGKSLAEFIDLSDVDELFDSIRLEETLDELTVAVHHENVKEVFRQMGGA
jgi:hypothetical protein